MYSVDGMAGRETLTAERRMAAHIAKKWQRPYHQMLPFVRLRMRLALAKSNSLLIRGSRDRRLTIKMPGVIKVGTESKQDARKQRSYLQ